ncbi:MAG: NAD(+)/NADH kinase [Halobacteriales archaeon]
MKPASVGLVSYYVRHDAHEPESDGQQERITESTETVREVAELLDGVDVGLRINPEAAEPIGREGVDVEEMAGEIDLLVTVGGDGTVLRALAALNEPTPVLGVNTGRVGFLADVEPRDAVAAVETALEGFDVERRGRLSVEVDGERLPPALNETVIVTSRPAKILAFDVHHEGELVESIRSDGVVVATPTGSTAYSMSAGGPLVQPEVDSKLVVPLAPFRVNTAPWVLAADGETTVTPTRVEREASVVVDGTDVAEVGRGDEVVFGRADDALFVDTGRSFFDRVREKLY